MAGAVGFCCAEVLMAGVVGLCCVMAGCWDVRL